jgi:hypothetical protein
LLSLGLAGKQAACFRRVVTLEQILPFGRFACGEDLFQLLPGAFI